MPEAFAHSITGSSPENKQWNADDVGQSDDESGCGIGKAHRLHDLRQPKLDSIFTKTNTETDEPKGDDPRIAQRLPGTGMAGELFRSDTFDNDVLLFTRKPCRIQGTVWKEFKDRKGQKARRQSFN